MKKLLVTVSSGTVSEAVRETINALVTALQERSVTLTGIMQSKITFQPSTIMKEDIDFMVNELEYSYAKIPNVTYPTTVMSDNGKDREYYLRAIVEEQKVSVIINVDAGLITVYED